jgi:hypothetical protein
MTIKAHARIGYITLVIFNGDLADDYLPPAKLRRPLCDTPLWYLR